MGIVERLVRLEDQQTGASTFNKTLD